MIYVDKNKIKDSRIAKELDGKEYNIIEPIRKIDYEGKEIILYKCEEVKMKKLDIFDGGDD